MRHLLYYFSYCYVLYILLVSILMREVITNKIQCKFLSREQQKTIHKIIINPKTTPQMRETINNILYSYYEPWAVSEANRFRKLHPHKCTIIHPEELKIAAKYGLYKGICKYDPSKSSNFIKFVSIYVKSMLYSELTKNMKPYNYKPWTKTVLFYGIDYWKLEKWKKKDHFIAEDKFDSDDLWQKIDQIEDPFTKRIFYLKFDREFNKAMSNKEIAEYMCCSEEKVRKQLSTQINEIAKTI